MVVTDPAHPISKHAEKTFESQEDELSSRLDRSTLEHSEAATAGHLIDLIDVFFALVLGGGILKFSRTFSAPWDSNLPAILALGVIYYTVIRSYLGWHQAVETRRYRIIAKGAKTTELWRVYIDVLIVTVYAYMLLVAQPLQHHPGADIAPLLFAFPVIFALYWVWGYLRQVAWGRDDYTAWVLVGFGALCAAVAFGYRFSPLHISASRAVANDICLVATWLLMIIYRMINFSQSGLSKAMKWSPHLPSLKIKDPEV